jgi:hypothetical protein
MDLYTRVCRAIVRITAAEAGRDVIADPRHAAMHQPAGGEARVTPLSHEAYGA